MTKQVSSKTVVIDDKTDLYRDHMRELMEALVTVGALVAVSDGRMRPAKGEALVNYIDRRHLFPTISRSEIEQCLANRARELQERNGFEVIMRAFHRLTGFFSGPMVVGVAERVATADGAVRPSELGALNLIRLMMLNPPVGASEAESSRLPIAAL
jgi:tellurite resistance protein